MNYIPNSSTRSLLFVLCAGLLTQGLCGSDSRAMKTIPVDTVWAANMVSFALHTEETRQRPTSEFPVHQVFL